MDLTKMFGMENIQFLCFLNTDMGVALQKQKMIQNLLDEVREVQDIEEEVGPDDAGDASEEESAGEFRPSVGCLELIRGLLPASQGQRWCSGWLSFIEGCNTIHCQADTENDNEAAGGQ